jgi:Phage integrase family
VRFNSSYNIQQFCDEGVLNSLRFPDGTSAGFLRTPLLRRQGGLHAIPDSPSRLTNDGHDTRALQHYLGHRNIQHTVRYTEMAPDRFKDFWRGY